MPLELQEGEQVLREMTAHLVELAPGEEPQDSFQHWGERDRGSTLVLTDRRLSFDAPPPYGRQYELAAIESVRPWQVSRGPASSFDGRGGAPPGLVITLRGGVEVTVQPLLFRGAREERDLWVGLISKAVYALRSRSRLDDEPGGAEPCVFVSYRRADGRGVADRLCERLVAELGRDAVFRDLDSIALGLDYRVVLAGALERCKAGLVIIGERWLSLRTEDGLPRLEDPDDVVRFEIQALLDRRIPLIPILIEGASMPRRSELPAGLEGLASRNGLRVRPDPDFENDLERLVRGIRAHLDPTPGRRGRGADGGPARVDSAKPP